MKVLKIKLFFFQIIIISSTLYGQNFKKVDELIEEKKYLSAWNYLEKKDPKNEKPAFVIKKTEMVLKYFTKTYSHKKFAFKDLEKNQSLLSARSKSEEEMLPMIDFFPPAVIDSLKKKYPKNYELNLILGDYFYDVYFRYKGLWLMPQQEVIRLFFVNYKLAEENGIKTAASLYALGLFYNKNEEYLKSQNYFEQSVQLDSTYAPSLYNLANMYSQIDSVEAAIKLAVKAYENYEDPAFKSDAARMAGILLFRSNNTEQAIKYLLIADQLLPSNYYTYVFLLKAYLKVNKITEANLVTKNLFGLDWKNHTISNAIIESYLAENQSEEIIKFFDQKLKEEQYDMEFRGYMFFHLSQIYLQRENKEKALLNIQESRKAFSIALDGGNPLFATIDKMEMLINQLK